jgi:hypothetical protein
VRINAYRGASFGAGVHDGHVGFHVGYQRFTATPSEAEELARQLLKAVENVTNANERHQP